MLKLIEIIKIGKDVNIIGSFYNTDNNDSTLPNLKLISISNSVEEITDNALRENTNIQDVIFELPSKVKKLGQYAFYNTNASKPLKRNCNAKCFEI